MGRSGKEGNIVASIPRKERLTPQSDNQSRSLTPCVQGNPLVAIIELSLSSWQIAGMLRGVARQPLQKFNPDFLLARWLQAHDIETYVIHFTSGAVSRDRRRGKTDRPDTAMLIGVFIGWLRGSLVIAVWSSSRQFIKKSPNADAASVRTWLG